MLRHKWPKLDVSSFYVLSFKLNTFGLKISSQSKQEDFKMSPWDFETGQESFTGEKYQEKFDIDSLKLVE